VKSSALTQHQAVNNSQNIRQLVGIKRTFSDAQNDLSASTASFLGEKPPLQSNVRIQALHNKSAVVFQANVLKNNTNESNLSLASTLSVKNNYLLGRIVPSLDPRCKLNLYCVPAFSAFVSLK
jgi:hypothetical protein